MSSPVGRDRLNAAADPSDDRSPPFGDAAESRRRVDLDWLRISAFAILILYHVGLLYIPWPYHAKSIHSVPAIEPLMRLVNPWRLLLLFLISGCATRFLAQRLRPGLLLANRSVRLLVPLLFGILVVVPSQSYVQAVEQFGYRAGLLQFYVAAYLGGTERICAATCLALPTWNHLWFVLYLYAYTVLLVAITILSRPIRPLCLTLANRLAASGALVLLPVLFLILARAVLLRSFPPNDAFFGDWYDHTVYYAFFLLGYLMAGQDAAWRSLDRCRWPALIVALGTAALAWPSKALPLPAWSGVLHQHGTVAVPLYQWSTIVAIIAFGRRWLPSTDGPWRRYLTEAVFPFYIVHQTVIVLLTAAACFTTFEVVRRTRWLRPLFGLRLERASQSL